MNIRNLTLVGFMVMTIMFSCTGCGLEIIVGSGEKVTENREVTEFSRIDVAVAGNLYITQGEEHSLVIEGDDNIVALLSSKVEDGTLKIEIESKPFASIKPMNPLNITVTLVEIEGVDYAGSGTIEAGDIITEDLSFEIAGSAKLNLPNLQANTFSIEIAGSGTVDASGSVDSLEIEIAGSGKVNAVDLYCETCAIDIAGSGNATINVSEELEVEIAGSGTIRYAGDPEVSMDIAGSGSVEKLPE